jgi:hypothetical protein
MSPRTAPDAGDPQPLKRERRAPWQERATSKLDWKTVHSLYTADCHSSATENASLPGDDFDLSKHRIVGTHFFGLIQDNPEAAADDCGSRTQQTPEHCANTNQRSVYASGGANA